MSKPYVILGAGGHARVLANTLLAQGWILRGCVAPQKPDFEIPGCPYLGDEAAQAFAKDDVVLANGVGSVGPTLQRREAFLTWYRLGFRFPPIAQPTATIARGAVLRDGVIIMAGAVLQTGVRLAENALINTNATVEHDCHVGAHSHVATGAVLCGNVILGEGVHVGAGATIVQNIRIGNNAVVGAGAVVVKDVPHGAVVVGVPARVVGR